MDNRLITGIIGVVVVVALLGSALVPVIDSIAGGVEYEDNPDWDGWVRFDLNTSADAAYHLEMSQDENGIYVENLFSESRDMQIYDDSTTVEYPTIMYADSNTVVWSDDDTFNVMGKINGSPVFVNAPILDITRDANGVEVVTDTDTYLFDAPTWAYVPLSQGKYGFYPYNEDRGVEHPANAPTAVLGGGNVGVWAYNNSYRYDGLGLVMNPIVEDGMYYGATWGRSAESDEIQSINPDVLDPAVIDLNPIDFDPITLDPGAQLMSVPTPTYTDGDWGYDLTTVNDVMMAIIVSYSGSGGGVITIPSTIAGYDVYQVGKGGSSNVIDTTLSFSGLVISEGIQVIGAKAFDGVTNLVGPVTLPSTLVSIGKYAFENTGITGDFIIPDGVTTIGDRILNNCAGITGTIVIPHSVTTYGETMFAYTKPTQMIVASDVVPSSNIGRNTLTDFLNLSTVEYTNGYSGIPNGTTIYTTIGDCFGFVSIVTTERGSSGALGGAAALLYAIPVVIIAAMLVAGVGWFIGKRY